MLWESAYSELLFDKAYWPDFKEKNLQAALDSYSSRQRRFGK
jgi:undecaprenyl diphosphate synthase